MKITLTKKSTELPAVLERRVQQARTVLAHQHDPALLDALSERELAEKRALAEAVREHELKDQYARLDSAAAAAKRTRSTVAALADREAEELLLAQRAISDARRATSPQSRLARLYKRRTLVLRILTSVMIAAMLYSAVTVQQNIAPAGGVTNPMFWFSYALEALISGSLLAIMLIDSDTVEWLPEVESQKGIEVALLAVTIGLNTFPYIKSLDFYGTVVHTIAPVMMGVALSIHDRATRRYGNAIIRATETITDTDEITTRLAELTRMTADPMGSSFAHADVAVPHHRTAERVDLSPAPALEQPAPAVRDDAETRTPHLETRTTAGAGQPAPAVNPAPAPAPAVDSAAARTTAGPAPAPAPAVRDNSVAATPDNTADSAAELALVRTRTEIPHPAASGDAIDTETRTTSATDDLHSTDQGSTTGTETSDNADTSIDAGTRPAVTEAIDAAQAPVDEHAGAADADTATTDDQARTDAPAAVGERPLSGAKPAVRARTTPHQLTSRRISPAPAPARTGAPLVTAAAAAQQLPEWMSPVFELAEEVKARGVAKTKTVEEVAAVITAIDAGAKNNAIATAPETRMSHSTVASIRKTAAEIRNEHRGGGRVIELRK
ncbi:hypothetical protein IU459_32945 [Nocardia amamiensis]|uniref:Uncharacterized protein n=1 Tax=Nocardia amamiensis TaxID=404578 RepID=A0ABS0D0E5_9NOCA|nr:hypothetical protein [Nocardia amamiensis]MBF6302314.1 hypothetical protein [Nocardia amamiensis]